LGQVIGKGNRIFEMASLRGENGSSTLITGSCLKTARGDGNILRAPNGGQDAAAFNRNKIGRGVGRESLRKVFQAAQ
jgi:hypothetical protein